MSAETKFTKGEWRVNYTGTHWNNPELRNIEINYGDQGECICDTVYLDSDAHLIAAAPDMYKLLDEIAVSMECFHGVDTNSIYELLAKARGESQ